MNVTTQESAAQEKKVLKSRHLSILDFIETLQLEYIVADLRHKIYPKLKDKAYWGRVKEGKKATIQKLAEKNMLPSIFTDEEMLRTLEQKVYRPVSYPLFTYRDDNHKMEQEYYDFLYYYLKGADVRVDDNGEVLVGKITKEYVPFNTQIFVSIAGVERKFHYNTVTRIL